METTEIDVEIRLPPMRSRSALNLIGQTFGRLKVVSYQGAHPRRKSSLWVCICICGARTIVGTSDLRNGHTASCGCAHREAFTRRSHDMCHSHLYQVWANMLQRCTNPKNSHYQRYGGRGIQVCDAWRRFEGFAGDMLATFVPGLTLERVNNDGNYEPGNCKWATMIEQANNKSMNRMLTHAGKTLSLANWARELGIKRRTLKARLAYGWTDEEVLSTPLQLRGEARLRALESR